MKLNLQLFYNLIAILSFTAFYSQNSGIKGVVIDDKTGQSLPGATVSIKGLNKSRVTDAEGNFIFSKIEPGTYELKVTALTFQEKEITEVIVVKDEINALTISLVEKSNQLDEVVITTTKAKLESVKSLLTMQKNSANVSDGISAETIKRTPDKNTSDVLKRISGASIQDNRFVIVRGLNDRYNASFLNGAPLPSSESDRKAFSFDIFPSNMLDNIIITKTATPNMPADFGGGVIDINTKSVPDKDFQSVTVGTGYNTFSTFRNQKTYEGSSTDWLGFDDGKRSLPGTIPSTDAFNALSDQEKANVAKSFQSDWRIKDSNFKPNTSLQYSIGRHFEFGNKTLGMLFSLTNSKTNTYTETERYDYDNTPNSPSVLTKSYLDKNYIEEVLTGGIANLSFKFNENHNISFKNIYSINSKDLVVDRNGKTDVNNTIVTDSDVRWFTSNKIYSGQFIGDHYFSKPKIKVNWTGFLSDIKRSIPNLRRNIYNTIDPNSTDPTQTTPIAAIASNNGGPDYGGGMFFSENMESIKGGKIDISKKFNLGEESINEIKIGGFFQERSRSFYSRQLQYNKLTTLGGTFDSSLLTLPNASIFSVNNMGQISPGVNGFTLYEFTKPTDSYVAASKLNAGYIMIDNRYEKFRLVWGVRFEDYVQTLDSKLSDTEYLAQYNRQNDFLPSANLIFSINKKSNLRLSYSKTLNRPEFRELAPFGFYDFTTQFFTQGADLKIAKIQNYDFRYETFPGKGQMFSVSLFYKDFKDPIEIKQEINNKTVTYNNADSAKNMGVEMEFRTLLSSIFTSDRTTVFDDITLFSNISIIKSKVDVSSFNQANVEKNRPLQGQSPYVFNAGLQYINKNNGWAISMNINRVGNRVYYAGNEIKPSLWEKARTFLDMQVAKTFYKNKLELKLNIQNVLAQDLIFYQNNYKTKVNNNTAITDITNYIFTGSVHNEDGYDAGQDDLIWSTKFGRTFSLSMTYNF